MHDFLKGSIAMKTTRSLIAWGVGLCLFISAAQGHVMLEQSSPANGAVLNAAPKSIDLTFGHATKLVMLKLVKGVEVVPLRVDGSAQEAKTFSIPLPALTSGQYQATWSTLSADGHPMKGKFSFTLLGK
jgi:methionine-rich copper-binding protein CopC